MAVYRAPGEWTECVALLAGVLDERSRWRLVPLMLGMLFASGRRTVTTWLRAAVLQRDYRDFDHFLQTVGRGWLAVGDQVLALVVKRVITSSRVLLVIDDSPTKRYGPNKSKEQIKGDKSKDKSKGTGPTLFGTANDGDSTRRSSLGNSHDPRGSVSDAGARRFWLVG